MLPSESHDEGFTLVEVLMALIVLGIGISALLVAMGMHVKTSVANRNQAAAASFLTTAAEYVKSYGWTANVTVPGPPPQCALISGPTAFPAANQPAPPSGFTATYSNGQAVPGDTGHCELQQITIDVTGFGYHLQVDVLKRPQTAVTP